MMLFGNTLTVKFIRFWDLDNRNLIYYYPSELNVIMEVAKAKNVLPCPPTVNIQLQEIIEDA